MRSLDRILTIAEVARIAGWSRRRMLRRLQRIESREGVQLLVNVGTAAHPNWTVTLRALERVAPAWFSETETVEAQVDELQERVGRVENMLEMVVSRVAAA